MYLGGALPHSFSLAVAVVVAVMELLVFHAESVS